MVARMDAHTEEAAQRLRDEIVAWSDENLVGKMRVDRETLGVVERLAEERTGVPMRAELDPDNPAVIVLHPC